jgi:hypothetical protein
MYGFLEKMKLTINDNSVDFRELLTQDELIEFLRIPEVSKAEDYNNVIDNLKRMHNLPCIHICKQPIYPLSAIRKWVEDKLLKEQR